MHAGLWGAFVAAAAAYLGRLQTAGAQFNQDDLGGIEKLSAIGDATLIECYVRVRMALRKFIVTSRGYFGVTHGYPALDLKIDRCCIIFGARLPVILRKAGKDGYYKLLGQVYIQGEGSALFGFPRANPGSIGLLKRKMFF
ncbi:hypothetical protein QBC37DRAFT_197219 [Rhypophila decipiens]|uniref:Uncharacterized protein n=1 Tax=Rhypophila decipiens TaxID=261697 RepID=A0AAN6Y6D3_9PEZI|nr:hypothetical protein QBC37DRAFT_197219 [Rhypophila decipiens]